MVFFRLQNWAFTLFLGSHDEKYNTHTDKHMFNYLSGLPLKTNIDYLRYTLSINILKRRA